MVVHHVPQNLFLWVYNRRGGQLVFSELGKHESSIYEVLTRMMLTVFGQKLCCNNPWCIRHDFIYPFTVAQGLISLIVFQYCLTLYGEEEVRVCSDDEVAHFNIQQF